MGWCSFRVLYVLLVGDGSLFSGFWWCSVVFRYFLLLVVLVGDSWVFRYYLFFIA